MIGSKRFEGDIRNPGTQVSRGILRNLGLMNPFGLWPGCNPGLQVKCGGRETNKKMHKDRGPLFPFPRLEKIKAVIVISFHNHAIFNFLLKRCGILFVVLSFIVHINDRRPSTISNQQLRTHPAFSAPQL